MTSHFFGKQLTSSQEQLLQEILGEEMTEQRRQFDTGEDEGKLTPAVVEQMAGEYDTIDEFLQALKDLPDVLKAEAEREA